MECTIVPILVVEDTDLARDTLANRVSLTAIVLTLTAIPSAVSRTPRNDLI